ncbi:MAG: hypothetical protein MSJ26_05135 [Oscillospiraceae bacterium]|nr:hypothetical protein [Oscillospiraceae bacterium]
MGDYKLINLRQDYYNDIKPQELDGIYKMQKKMRKQAWSYNIFHCILVLILAVILGCSFFIGIRSGEANIFLLLCFVAVSAECIVSGKNELRKWQNFYFGKGKIVSVESRSPEGSKRRPDGKYCSALTIAVSKTEAVGNILYYSDEPLEPEDYIGREAVAVYFPNAHLLYAVIGSENACNDTDKPAEEIHENNDGLVKNSGFVKKSRRSKN